jgi:hypothetical protein
MDHTGKEKKFFQFDGNKKPLFSLPIRIASNSRNNIGVIDCLSMNPLILVYQIKVITKLPNSEQSYKGKVKTHNYINRQNQSTTGKLKTVMTLTWYRHF